MVSHFIDGTQQLRTTVNPALDSASLDLIQKYYQKLRDYEAAYYMEGNQTGKEVEMLSKTIYKSHGRVLVRI